MDKDVSLGFLWREDEVGGRFAVSLARFLLMQNPINHVLDVMSGPDLAKGRNALVSQFLETGDRVLIMLDSDMVFEPKSVLLLDHVNEEGLVVGGLCVDSTGKRTLYRWAQDDFYPTTWGWDLNDPKTPKLLRVDGTGAACLRIPRLVLEKIGGDWFTEIPPYSEDLSFCLRLREAGIHLAVHTGARFGHSKSHVLWP